MVWGIYAVKKFQLPELIIVGKPEIEGSKFGPRTASVPLSFSI
jgi:hypothetical protein